MKNQYGKTVYNEALDRCYNCDRLRCNHTPQQVIECARAIGNDV